MKRKEGNKEELKPRSAQRCPQTKIPKSSTSPNIKREFYYFIKTRFLMFISKQNKRFKSILGTFCAKSKFTRIKQFQSILNLIVQKRNDNIILLNQKYSFDKMHSEKINSIFIMEKQTFHMRINVLLCSDTGVQSKQTTRRF